MDEKVIKTVNTIMAKFHERHDMTKTKIASLLISIYNGKMDNLVGIDDELLTDVEDFERMINTLEILEQKNNLNFKSKQIKVVVKRMRVKLFNLKLAIEVSDFKALNVIAKEFLRDINELDGI